MYAGVTGIALLLTETIDFCQEPVRSARIDSYIRVTDDGRESIHRKVSTLDLAY